MSLMFQVLRKTASVHTLHMPKPNVTRVQSASEWTASVHALHMPKPNVTRVQSATQWIASVHALHMPKPTVGGLGSEGDKTVLLGPKNWNPISSSKCTVLARHG